MSLTHRIRFPVAAAALCAWLTNCRGDERTTAPLTPPAMVMAAAGPTWSVTLVGAGNIAKCGQPGAGQTATLLDSIAGTVFADGDAAYDNGTSQQYTQCYVPTWGRHKARTQPSPGDRDYKTANASGYFGYFGAAAGDPSKGYYSYDLGTWHIIVLNSGSPQLVPTTATSAQVAWLKADLASHPAMCTLAYWHHPLFESKDNPNQTVRPLWDALYASGADVIVNAHYAFYERFAPQTPAGIADPAYGIREFVVGTGGAELQAPGKARANSEIRNGSTYGVLALSLDDGAYSWQFVPIKGKTFRDSGTASCHGPRPPAVNAGPDQAVSPGDTVRLSVSFSDPSGAAPWSYTIQWGDATSTSGTTQTQTSAIVATHVYGTVALDSVVASVTNAFGTTGADTVAVNVAPYAVFVGAGDMADCTPNNDALTANLIDTIPGTVFVLGDNAYPNGAPSDYANCYQPTWGRFKSRTRPIPGNHDYQTSGASGYFGYFGAAAGDPSKGYYSYDVGSWHVVALNSNIASGETSTQVQWLKADLAANPRRCTLAVWHHPTFTSGSLADTVTRSFWRALYAAGAELVLHGHEHNYERFAPQTPTQVADPAFGIREIVVGTGGGEGLFGFLSPPAPNSEVRNSSTYGVLKLRLYPNGYDWKFYPIAGQTFTDAGSGTCHDAPGGAPPVNQPPTAAAGGPYTGVEGSSVAFNGGGSSDPDGDPLTYAWMFGDGATGTGATPTHAYVDNGSYTVSLTVTDSHGASSTASTTTATIANAAPTVSAGPNQQVAVGATVTINPVFHDAGSNDAPWGYRIDWGDGTPATTGSVTTQANPITASHSYLLPGTDVVQIAVTDKDGGSGSGSLTVTVSTSPPPPPQSVTLVGAGNIARCTSGNDDATANLLDTIPGTVFVLGDNAFPGGTASAYANCYDPTWGRQKSRTFPTIGNHEYDSTATADGYFGYFGAAAGDPAKGYYSYDLGAWHIIVLNSNTAFVSAALGSPQEQWLKNDLAATTKQCVLAMWHNPRFYSTTSSSFFPTSSVKPLWDDLYAAGAELIINAHMRDYERFAPQDPAGNADPSRGIREIIVGTGGDGIDAPNTLIIPNSEARISGVYGVLRLTLSDGSYSWQFVPVAGQSATDSGSGSCH